MKVRRERRWRSGDGLEGRNRPSRSLLVALVLASASLVVLDQQGGASSPVDPLRSAVGGAFGPVETAAATVVRPFTAVPAWLRSKGAMGEEIRDLDAENADLRAQLAAAGVDRNRLEEYDGLTSTAEQLGQALVPARVVAYGPSQSFSRTVTIDAGAQAGVRPDQTVVSDDGLVGRVLRTTRTTATVLLAIDQQSIVGGRVGTSMELGFVHGVGGFGAGEGLELRLVDEAVVPDEHESVVTWGSSGAGPYVAGVPVGRVTEVYSSLRDSSQRAVIEPYVDFSALDVVGVVVPSGSTSDRAVVEADGSLR